MEKHCIACYKLKENPEWKYCRSCHRKIQAAKYERETGVKMQRVNQTTTGCESLDEKVRKHFPR